MIIYTLNDVAEALGKKRQSLKDARSRGYIKTSQSGQVFSVSGAFVGYTEKGFAEVKAHYELKALKKPNN